MTLLAKPAIRPEDARNPIRHLGLDWVSRRALPPRRPLRLPDPPIGRGCRLPSNVSGRRTMPDVPAPSSSGSSPTARKLIDPTVSGVFYALGAFVMWGVLPLMFRAL